MCRAIIPSSKLQLGIQVVVLPRESAKDEFRVYVVLDVIYIDQPHRSTRRYYEVRWMSCHERVTILLADHSMGHGLDGARGTSNIFYVHTPSDIMLVAYPMDNPTFLREKCSKFKNFVTI